MSSNIIQAGSHANNLASAFGHLFKSSRFCDVEVHVGKDIFKCHKLVLVMQSSYFQELFFPAVPASSSRASPDSIIIDNVAPEDFQCILGYLYEGEIELDRSNVERILCLSKLFCMEAVEHVCLQYVRETLDGHTYSQYWKVAEIAKESELREACLEIFASKFFQLNKTADLQMISQDMMEAVTERDDLQVKNEQIVCEILLKWFDANRLDGQCIKPYQLLCKVRWSGVSIEYLKSNMIDNEVLVKDQQSIAYFLRVISYRLTGTQFPGLLTHHRPSTDLEECVVIFGTNNGVNCARDSCRVSLQKGNDVGTIVDLPTEMNVEVNACVNNRSVYITGLGADRRETWRWEAVGGWARCGDMIQGRRRHFTTFVNNSSVYALGGGVNSMITTLSSVEQFNTMKNTWKTAGKLVNCVHNAGGVAYKSSIYLFGGSYYDKSTKGDIWLDCIQEYDTTSEQCTLLIQHLPKPMGLLRAVLWDESVILINNIGCLIFSLKKKTIQQRDQFKSGVVHFGQVIDNQTVFVFGGGVSQPDSRSGKLAWTYTDEVKSVPLMDIVDDKQTVTWTQHARLPSPSLVHAYAHITLANQ